jgi:lipoate-protein ligase A
MPALFLLRPAEPYVSIGFHQDAAQEIDLEYAAAQQLPVFRREVGGGAVYLDSQQLFYQLVLPKHHPALPGDKAGFYQKFLQPVVDTMRHFGAPAVFRPVNDILVNGRKISGNGAAEIGEMVVLVGNFIMDFNFEEMARVLRVPDEKFRDKVYKSLSTNLTTLRQELGAPPEARALAQELVRRLEPLLGRLEMGADLDPRLQRKADDLFSEMSTPEWLFLNDRRAALDPAIKIREGVFVIQKVVKLPGGLVRLTAGLEGERLAGVHLSGDFFIYPAKGLQALEAALEGLPLHVGVIEARLRQVMADEGIEMPGVQAEDLAGVFG